MKIGLLIGIQGAPCVLLRINLLIVHPPPPCHFQAFAKLASTQYFDAS